MVDVLGTPMLAAVLATLPRDIDLTMVISDDHPDPTPLATTAICSRAIRVGPTQGAACSALAAAPFIDNPDPLLIANCDQLVDVDWNDFFISMGHENCDGGILLFNEPDKDPKWSYVQMHDSWIWQVAEKNPISTLATCGVYYWKHGSDFCEFARQMIANDQRVNGEFYIAPTYQQAIDDGWNIRGYVVNSMVGLGTPEDLEAYVG